MSSADSGSMMQPADLTESIMTDDRISGVLSTRTNGLLGLPLSFAGGSPAASQALRGADESSGSTSPRGDFWQMFPEAELAKLTRWGLMLGVGIGQMVPMIDRQLGGREIPTLKTWHPRWLQRILPTTDPGFWRLTTASATIEIDPNDPQWIIYCPYGGDRPWADGAWRSTSFAWILKQFALHDRARHSEVAGSPARVGVAPEGATQKGRQQWLSQLKNMGRDTSLVLPPGYDLKLVESTARTWEIYTKQIEWADRASTVVLAGQIVTTEGSPGFSRGNIHERIARDLIRFTSETLSTTLRDQALKPWAALNFGNADVAPWPQWDTTPPEDQKQKADTTRVLGEAIGKLDEVLAASKQRVDAVAIVESAGVPLLPIDQTGEATPNVELAPTDLAGVVRVNEARASASLPPLLLPDGSPDPDGMITVAEFKAKQEAQANPQAAPVGPGAAPALPPGTPTPDDGPNAADQFSLDEARTLAAAMTEAKIERCAHGFNNRCRICRIQRVRTFDHDGAGNAVWGVEWRALEETGDEPKPKPPAALVGMHAPQPEAP
jgi:hypothetical protein